MTERKITRKELLKRSTIAVAGLSLLPASACGDDTEQGSTGPTQQTQNPEEVSPEWAQLVENAQGEGTLVLDTVVGDGYRNMAEQFGSRFGIEVQINQARSSDMATQMLQERQSEQYLRDAWFQTWSTMYTNLLPAGALDPVKPALIHPEVTEPDNWKGDSGIRYMDPEEESYLPVVGRLPALIYTTNEQEVDDAPKTLDDLLDLASRDEMSMAVPGQSGDCYLQWLYTTGREDFLRRLAEEQPSQLVDLSSAFRNLARGNFSIMLGGTEPRVAPVVEEGLPVNPVSFMPELEGTGGMVTFNASTPALINNAPHPNAAKLFVNWVMTKEGCYAACSGGGIEPLRKDVSSEFLRPHQTTDEEAFRNGRYALQDAEIINQLSEMRDVLINDIFQY